MAKGSQANSQQRHHRRRRQPKTVDQTRRSNKTEMNTEKPSEMDISNVSTSPKRSMDTNSSENTSDPNTTSENHRRDTEVATQDPQYENTSRSSQSQSEESRSTDTSVSKSSNSSEEDYSIYIRQGRRRTELTHEELEYYAVQDREKEPKSTYRTPSTESQARPLVDGRRLASDKSTQGPSTKTGVTEPTDSDRSRSRSPDGVRKPHGNRQKRYQTNPKTDKK
jgi:hypothetical protein